MRSKPDTILSSSQALFTVLLLVLFFTLLNGYLQNLVMGYRANPWLVLAGVVAELAAVLWFAHRHVVVERDLVELAGFVLVVVGVWIYFVTPSLPTLLPPTQSSDAVRVYQQILFSYPEGKLVSWYPAGGAFVAVMLAHWLDAAPLRVLHPTAAGFIALSAGAVYGMACTLLSRTGSPSWKSVLAPSLNVEECAQARERISKIAALLAPALLFVPWSYFAGTINWEQYFFAQVFAQYFTLAALWYTASYAETDRWIFAALTGMAFLGIVAAYPIFVALPIGLFLLAVLARVAVNTRHARNVQYTSGALAALGILVALMIVAAIALQHGGILELAAGYRSATSDVGAGGVTNPSLETLGGPLLLLLALVGIPLAWKANAMGKVLLAFLFTWLLQLITLVTIQPYFQVSGYRVDKTFYILIFPLALLATLFPAHMLDRVAARVELSRRTTVVAFMAAITLVSVGVLLFRPPKAYPLFTESELETALWAREHLDTYQINYLDPQPVRAYWLAFGLWGETLPNEWFQWIPAGTKLGPQNLNQWLDDPSWQPYLLVRDEDLGARMIESLPTKIVYRNGDSAILQKEMPPIAEPTPSIPTNWDFVETIRLIGYDLPHTTIAPGETLTLTTYTQALAPPRATVGWRVELTNRTGMVASKVEGEPFANKYPVQRWPPGRYTRDIWALPLDSQVSPGAYALKMSLYRRADGGLWDACITSQPVTSATCLLAAPLGTIKVPLPPPSMEELRMATPLHARVGDDFILVSYILEAERVTGRVHLTLYWQSTTKVQNNYTIFVHLLDALGKVIAQKDAEPLDGNYPTSIWDTGEIVKEEYELMLPPDAQAPFAIEIGMYAQPSLKRLPVGTDDHILLRDIIR